jgi:hypothetical protein
VRAVIAARKGAAASNFTQPLTLPKASRFTSGHKNPEKKIQHATIPFST